MTAFPYCCVAGPAGSTVHDIHQQCLKSRNGVCLVCQKLANIERKIDDARRALKNLLDEREKLAPVLNEHHDPFVNRLPVELASHIFVHCRPVEPTAYTSGNRYDEKKLINAVFLPGRICSNWRRISQSTPELWSILCTTITKRNCASSIAIISEWVERSGCLPLLIQLNSKLNSEDQATSLAARQVIAPILQHAQRWECLDLDINPELISWVSTTLSNRRLDCLEHIKAAIKAPGHIDILLDLKASPRRLTQRKGWICQLGFNWERLTHATFQSTYPEETANLFLHAPQLLFCKITTFDDDTELSNPVIAPSLRTLIIEKFTPMFWDQFTFPSLEILHAAYPSFDTDGPGCWPRLQSLLRRSQCHIQDLSVRANRSDGLIDVLKLTPDLEIFSTAGHLINRLFREINAIETQQQCSDSNLPFLRKLRSLRCVTATGHFDWTDLAVFLKSMATRKTHSLQRFEFLYKVDSTQNDFISLLDEDLLKNLLDSLHSMEVKIADGYNRDLVAGLRRQ